MPEQLQKLRPDRDLQCYFERPSAITALSGAAADRFTLSGTWRQQNDWAVVEWNRDNVFEHPMFRYLPDGDLSGLTLTYDEERSNCVGLDSTLYPIVDWPSLRIWTDANGVESFHKVKLKDHAVAIGGTYSTAFADFELSGTIAAGDYAGLSWGEEHHTYQIYATDTPSSVAASIVASINAFSPVMKAEQNGASIRLRYAGAGQTIANSTEGANGNRIGAYSYVSGGSALSWSQPFAYLSGGTSPSKWRITFQFGALQDENGQTVNTSSVRKMRWTYSAPFQRGAFVRSEYSVQVTNWTVTGGGRLYSVAGPGSRRIEDDDDVLRYSGDWTESKPGNFSGGGIHYASTPGASVTCSYSCPQTHSLYLGTRAAFNGGAIRCVVDDQPATVVSLALPGEDVLRRVLLGTFGAGTHQVRLEHAGAAGNYLYVDFLEVAIVATTLPEPPEDTIITLATDWDTDHSLAVAAERTAWMIRSLGFKGRANHYVGALWFYELTRVGHLYASGSITFSGSPAPNGVLSITIGRLGQPAGNTTLSHLVHVGDTAETIAKAFELRLNSGYTSVRASVTGSVLTIRSRSMGFDGNQVTIASSAGSSGLAVTASGAALMGGEDGEWYTDLVASPRLNRACRDWSRSFYQAMLAYGIDVAAAFSTELQHGDPRPETGIAQRYPSGNAVELNTPALQTNFSPASLAYWREVYREMADLLAEGGLVPYLQFGEVQWWYFAYDGSGLPFYDAYTTTRFQQEYGRPMATIVSGSVDPALHPEEAAFVANLIGEFTDAIMAHVRVTHPACRFEVLYPTDVNDTPFNAAANYPAWHWTPTKLDNLKTESFTYTYSRDLNKCLYSVRYAETKGFPSSKRSHLVGIGDPISPWTKEVDLSKAENNESVVLFALDQFCLIGYPAPIQRLTRRSSAIHS